MNELHVGTRQQFRFGVAENLLPRGIDPFEIAVEAGDAQQVERQSEETIQLLLRTTPIDEQADLVADTRSIDRRSSSGVRISRLKNSMTLCTSPRSRIGKPNAPCSPSRAAIVARGKFASRTTSWIQTGCACVHTRPGRPMPRPNVVVRLTASNSGNCSRRAHQVSTQRRRSASRSIRQSAPCTPSRALRKSLQGSWGAASPNVADSTSARAATCSAVRRRSACGSAPDDRGCSAIGG